MAFRSGTINGLSLCSGIAGIDLGLREALGGRYRGVCHVEREGYAAALLVARMEEARLDPAPCWSDITTFDGKPWRGVVHIVTAGYPCQGFSYAGKRKGKKDPRHLWPHVRRIVGEVRPLLVLLENVPGHLTLGFREVCSDLVGLGYRVGNDHGEPTFGLFSAEEVGAPHKRQRLFCLAYRDDHGREGEWLSRIFDCVREAQWNDPDGQGCPSGNLANDHGSGSESQLRPAAGRRPDSDLGSEGLVHAHDSGLEGRSLPAGGRTDQRAAWPPSSPLVHSDSERGERTGECGARRSQPESSGWDVGDPDGVSDQRRGVPDILAAPPGTVAREKDERERGWSPSGDSVEGVSIPEWPPGPDDEDGWRALLRVRPDLAPALTKSEIRRISHEFSSRVDELRALGNAVVPKVAAHEFRVLLWRALGRYAKPSKTKKARAKKAKKEGSRIRETLS